MMSQVGEDEEPVQPKLSLTLDCALDTDCNLGGDHSYYCTDASECLPNEDYPMCGPLWVSACAGKCDWDSPKR